MCLAGGLGAEVDITAAAYGLPDHAALFAESLCRFVVEVRPADEAAFVAALAGVPLARLGSVNESGTLHIRGQHSADLLRLPVAELEQAWRGAAAEPVPPSTAAPTASLPPSPPSLQPSPGAPRVLVLHATGTNRDRDAALACEVAGGAPEIVHVTQLLAGERSLLDYHMLVVPGGFSYGDDLGAGTLWALDMQHRLGTDMNDFVASGRPVLGICNGFQALVRAGLLPGGSGPRRVTLAPNAGGHFECRWVYLRPNPHSPCLFTQGLNDLIHCPVAHGEGRVLAADDATLRDLNAANLIALTYTDAQGEPGGYPLNPNGSALGIAGLCNAAGNVLGLMPHPEDHIFGWQHPRRHRGAVGQLGLRLFANGLKVAR
jgi:phosphoribosylformylglycinamidine synthase